VPPELNPTRPAPAAATTRSSGKIDAGAGADRRDISKEKAEFDHLLSGGSDEASRREEEKRSGSASSRPGEEPADDLSSLFGQAGQHLLGQEAAAASAGAATAPESLSEAGAKMEELVARILVSEPSAAEEQVRLIVDPNVFDDLEIHLTRGADGFLLVDLRSGDPNTLQSLVAHHVSLKESLEKSQGDAFRVTVTDTAREDDDQNRRSRGLGLEPADETTE
jgi:hypothetical protein